MNKSTIPLLISVLLSFSSFSAEITIAPKNTLSVVEVNSGDKVNYTLQNGRVVTIELLKTKVDIILTSLDTLKKSKRHNGTIYSMTAHIKIDGQDMGDKASNAESEGERV